MRGRVGVATATAAVLLVTGCTADADDGPPRDGAGDELPADGSPLGTRPEGSDEEFGPAGEDPDAVPAPDGAVDARLASLDDLTDEVEAALADASARSGVPIDAIAVASALTVTWADGALGCPQPGMAYTLALVPGYLLELEVAGERVAYHGRAGSDPFPCDWPAG